MAFGDDVIMFSQPCEEMENILYCHFCLGIITNKLFLGDENTIVLDGIVWKIMSTPK